MRDGRITIHDLAAIAGVSAGTVSRVINGREGVGQATREHVLKLVELHGFKANASAQRLSTGRANTIGVVFPLHAWEFATHPVYPALLGALGDAAAVAGYDILLLSIASAQEISRLTDAVHRRRVDGIVLPAAGPDDPLINELSRLNFPTVIIGHREKTSRIPWVDSAHDIASYELTRLLLDAGRRRLMLLNGPAHVSAFALRSQGFWSAVTEYGGPLEFVQEHEVGFGGETTKKQVSDLWRQAKGALPNGVVAANDSIGAACLELARDMKVRVPGQMAVTGFDDLTFSSYTAPPLTTARMPLQQLGSKAAEMLFTLIEGKTLRKRHLVLPTEIVLRGSTPPPGPAALAASSQPQPQPRPKTPASRSALGGSGDGSARPPLSGRGL